MFALQLIAGSAIFLQILLARELPAEAAFAVYLAFLILAAGGFAFSPVKIKLPIIALKCLLCLALRPYSDLPLLLLPTIAMEPPVLLYAKAGPWIWAVYAAVPLAAAAFTPRRSVAVFIGVWAFSVAVAFGELRRKAESARSAARIRLLEKELAEVETKRALMEKTAAGQELLIKFQERDSIAQKLHDQLGHTITGSIMQLEAAGLLLPDDPGRVADILSKLSRTLKDGLAAIRLSLRAIKPEPALLGLQKIQTLLDAFQADYGRGAELATEGDLRTIPALVWQAIESNLQEALTNTLKHSSGRNFVCRLSVMNRVIKAEFRDDGSAGRTVKRGMGLDGMEARTRETGGTLIIDTQNGFSAIMLFAKGD